MNPPNLSGEGWRGLEIAFSYIEDFFFWIFVWTSEMNGQAIGHRKDLCQWVDIDNDHSWVQSVGTSTDLRSLNVHPTSIDKYTFIGTSYFNLSNLYLVA